MYNPNTNFVFFNGSSSPLQSDIKLIVLFTRFILYDCKGVGVKPLSTLSIVLTQRLSEGYSFKVVAVKKGPSYVTPLNSI